MPGVLSDLAERITRAAGPREAADEMEAFVGRTQRLRITLYENAQRLSDVLGQRRDNVSETLSSADVTAEVSGGVLSFATAKLSGKASRSERIELTSLMKAVLLEETELQAGRLVDLTIESPRRGHVLRHVGDSWMFGPWDEQLATAETERALGSEVLTRLAAERAEQTRKLAWGKPDFPGTIVWAAREKVALAAIGSFESAVQGSLSSYAGSPPFGILAVLEAEREGLALLSPLVVWHESVDQEYGADP